jgi:hypothetical protein
VTKVSSLVEKKEAGEGYNFKNTPVNFKSLQTASTCGGSRACLPDTAKNKFKRSAGKTLATPKRSCCGDREKTASSAERLPMSGPGPSQNNHAAKADDNVRHIPSETGLAFFLAALARIT